MIDPADFFLTRAELFRTRYYVFDPAARTVRELDDDGYGDPLVVQWARVQGDIRRVAWDDVPDMHAHVSTVFIGFDFMHDAGMHPQPLLFETGVFYDDDTDTHQPMQLGFRCQSATLDDAEREHANALQQLRAGVRL